MVKRESSNKKKKIEAPSCKKGDSSKFVTIFVNANEVRRKLYLKDQVNPQKTPTSIYKGVRLRKWGRYSAEINDPIAKKRYWLGTFDHEIQAAIAYSKKMDEIEEKKLAASVELLDINQRCRECGGRFNYNDPSDDEDNNNIGGGMQEIQPLIN